MMSVWPTSWSSLSILCAAFRLNIPTASRRRDVRCPATPSALPMSLPRVRM